MFRKSSVPRPSMHGPWYPPTLVRLVEMYRGRDLVARLHGGSLWVSETATPEERQRLIQLLREADHH